MCLQFFRTKKPNNRGESKAEDEVEQAKNQAYEDEDELKEVEQGVNESSSYFPNQTTDEDVYLRPRNEFSVEN